MCFSHWSILNSANLSNHIENKIRLFDKYLLSLSDNYVLVPALGSGDASWNKIDKYHCGITIHSFMPSLFPIGHKSHQIHFRQCSQRIHDCYITNCCTTNILTQLRESTNWTYCLRLISCVMMKKQISILVYSTVKTTHPFN